MCIVSFLWFLNGYVGIAIVLIAFSKNHDGNVKFVEIKGVDYYRQIMNHAFF